MQYITQNGLNRIGDVVRGDGVYVAISLQINLSGYGDLNPVPATHLDCITVFDFIEEIVAAKYGDELIVLSRGSEKLTSKEIALIAAITTCPNHPIGGIFDGRLYILPSELLNMKPKMYSELCNGLLFPKLLTREVYIPSNMIYT